jgi:hypothetical protein
MKHETQRTRRRNGAEIKALVERYQQSGLSQAEFVRGEGICQVTLSRYLKKTRAVAASPGGGPAGRFIEVEHGARMLPADHESGSRRAPYRVNFGHGANLEIPAGFCRAEVASLLALLGGAR